MAHTTTATKTSQSIPTNTQAPHVLKPRHAVAQTTLAEVLKKRREVKQAEENLKALRHLLHVKEEAIIKALENGATVALGILTASVRYDERRNVKWREVAEQYLGSDFCQLVSEETEPTIYPRLIVA